MIVEMDRSIAEQKIKHLTYLLMFQAREPNVIGRLGGSGRGSIRRFGGVQPGLRGGALGGRGRDCEGVLGVLEGLAESSTGQEGDTQPRTARKSAEQRAENQDHNAAQG